MYAPLYLSSPSCAAELRIGVLADSASLPACFADVIEHIQSSNFARVRLVILKSGTNATAPDSLLFAAYRQWDSRQNANSQDPLAPVDCTARFANIDSITVDPVRRGSEEILSDDQILRICESDLDVIISLTSADLGGLFCAARYGVWSFRFGKEEYREGPPFFWEVYNKDVISSAALIATIGRPVRRHLLTQGFFSTVRGISWRQNLSQPYWGASTFPIQMLYRLHRFGWESIESESADFKVTVPATRFRVPTNVQMVRWLGPILPYKLATRGLRSITGLREPRWMLAVSRSDSAPVALSGATQLNTLEWIQSPPGHYYADPFLVEYLRKPWVFFEDYDDRAGKGRLACAEVIGDGRLSKIRPVLEKPYHLSYPCVFHDRGDLYLIPESLENGTVNLYRCRRFPDLWESVKVLFHAPAVDTTIWIEDETYWFFTTIYDKRGHGLQLWLFHSDTLTGDWTPHPQNPISTDIRSSRGGGAIHRNGGRLIRPTQDCSGSYGRRLVLNDIVTLNKKQYSEHPYVSVEPADIPRLVGVHTYAHLEGIEIIDGYILSPSGQHMPHNQRSFSTDNQLNRPAPIQDSAIVPSE